MSTVTNFNYVNYFHHPFSTLKHLMLHLNRLSERVADTGMTARNLSIVWAPNLLRTPFSSSSASASSSFSSGVASANSSSLTNSLTSSADGKTGLNERRVDFEASPTLSKNSRYQTTSLQWLPCFFVFHHWSSAQKGQTSKPFLSFAAVTTVR